MINAYFYSIKGCLFRFTCPLWRQSTGYHGRLALGRSCHRGELCERRRKKRIQTPKEEEFRAGSMNAGTMRGRSAEIVETATRMRLDCGFLQETKWKGVLFPSQSRSQVRWLKGKDSVYKVFWSGNSEGTNGVGILLAKKWTDKVFWSPMP